MKNILILSFLINFSAQATTSAGNGCDTHFLARVEKIESTRNPNGLQTVHFQVVKQVKGESPRELILKIPSLSHIKLDVGEIMNVTTQSGRLCGIKNHQ